MTTELMADPMARAFRQQAGGSASVQPGARLQPGMVLVALTGALAFSGLGELLLQRIIYRVGVHIPRDGAFLEAYRFATVSGDFAFRVTAVMLAIAAVAMLSTLLERRSYVTAGLLSALLAANLLAWPLHAGAGAQLAPFIFAFAAAWLSGRALANGRPLILGAVALAAGLALTVSQYQAGMTAAGREPASLATMQMASEVALLVAAFLAALSALQSPVSRKALAIAAFLTLGLASAYMREPSTVAIVSLWATGVTMSLPGILYIFGFAAAAFACISWLASPRTRHLSVALLLLLIAGLQPQALHHGITAFLGLALLSAGLEEAPARRTLTEVANAA